jgi:hypothetical protein
MTVDLLLNYGLVRGGVTFDEVIDIGTTAASSTVQVRVSNTGVSLLTVSDVYGLNVAGYDDLVDSLPTPTSFTVPAPSFADTEFQCTSDANNYPSQRTRIAIEHDDPGKPSPFYFYIEGTTT